jgi:hypothetical protein
MRRAFLVAAATLALWGSAQAQPARPPVVSLAPRAAPVDTPQVARIRAALKGYLRDEKTARIVIVRDAGHDSVNAYGRTQTGRLLCAQVNAKNDKGAYAGYRPFMFVLLDGGGVGVWQHGMLRGSNRVIEAKCGWSAKR